MNCRQYVDPNKIPDITDEEKPGFYAIGLFSKALYKEYKTVVLTIGTIIVALLGLILWNTHKKWIPYIVFFASWILEVFKLSIKKYKEMKENIVNKS